jgi:hypothetical protein
MEPDSKADIPMVLQEAVPKIVTTTEQEKVNAITEIPVHTVKPKEPRKKKKKEAKKAPEEKKKEIPEIKVPEQKVEVVVAPPDPKVLYLHNFPLFQMYNNLIGFGMESKASRD